MTTRTHKGPTPIQIARYGHIAASLRKAMSDQNITASEVKRRLGHSKGNSGVYIWKGGWGAPGPTIAKKLSEMLSIPIEDLRARDVDSSDLSNYNSRPPSARMAKPAAPASAETLSGELLSFQPLPEGMACIQINLQLPKAKALSLFRAIVELIADDTEEAETDV